MLKELIEQHKERVKEVYRLGRIIGEKICEALRPYVNISFRIGGYESGVETLIFFIQLPPEEKDKGEYVSMVDLLGEIEDEEGYSFWVIDLVEGLSYPIFDFRECYVPKGVAQQVKQALKDVLFGS